MGPARSGSGRVWLGRAPGGSPLCDLQPLAPVSARTRSQRSWRPPSQTADSSGVLQPETRPFASRTEFSATERAPGVPRLLGEWRGGGEWHLTAPRSGPHSAGPAGHGPDCVREDCNPDKTTPLTATLVVLLIAAIRLSPGCELVSRTRGELPAGLSLGTRATFLGVMDGREAVGARVIGPGRRSGTPTRAHTGANSHQPIHPNSRSLPRFNLSATQLSTNDQIAPITSSQ